MSDLEVLKKHKPSFIGLEQQRKFSICIPLLAGKAGWEVLFEVRSEKIGRQPGDVCFPGGAVEPGEDPLDAAFRETREELCVQQEQMELIAPLDWYLNYSGNLIFPYAMILKNYENTWSPDEVKETFTVPLSFFLETEPELYVSKLRVEPDEAFPYDRIRGGREYPWRMGKHQVYFYQYGDRVIWGMTARLILSFVDIYKKETAQDKK